MSIRVLVADDHRLVRKGVCELLGRLPDVDVVAEAGDGREAARLARKLGPDVVLMDIRMPELNGIEATRQIRAACPSTKVIALSAQSGRQPVVEMLRAGATGYVTKDCASEELVAAIQAVAGEKAYLSPLVAKTVVEDYVSKATKASSSAYSVLTGREREALQLIAEGKTTKEVASCLHVSVKTAETHRRQLMGKLDLHSVAELTRFAVREGLVPLGL